MDGDGPESSTLQALLALPLCRLLPNATAVLATAARATAEKDEVLVTAVAGARFKDGAPVRAADIAEALRRVASGQGPYAPLLSPVAGLEEALLSAAQHPEAPLRLRLVHPWPDFEASLCHPAFTPTRTPPKGPARGVGLYAQDAEGRFLAQKGAPGGPPFPAALAFSALPARTAQRLLQAGEVQAVLGEASTADAGPLLFATYLVYRPGALPEGALSALAKVDLEALVRTFVPGPAVAMHALLPPGLLGSGPMPAPLKATPTAATGARTFTLGYEAALAEQRAVAERLQVLLHDAGYKVRLRGETRDGLARARAAGDVEAALVSVLLPPLPAPALAVVLGLAMDKSLLARELPSLGAVADTAARASLVRERALSLQPGLSLLPLFARGLRVQTSVALLDAYRDGFGLLVLDDAWLAH